ncbi:CaiB/BaiF CoA-transferase family protein [Niabella terrae]
MNPQPLKGLVVLEFCHYLAGPSAGLRLADLGARVIKIEKPEDGDPSRRMVIKNLMADENSLLFHTINRNKDSFAANLKSKEGLAEVIELIRQADVMTHSFRPGVMEKLGLSFAEVQKINPRIIYLELTGYGKRGPWMHKPGQDLLLQALTGLAYTSGDATQGPVPIGISVIDQFCGVQAVQVILGALIRRQKTGRGGFLEISLFESAISMQFELLTTFYNSKDGLRRSKVHNGSPLLGAPYGIYRTTDGYISLAMMDLNTLQEALGADILQGHDAGEAFTYRDAIKHSIQQVLATNRTDYWIGRLLEHKLWATRVYNWKEMQAQPAYAELEMEQTLELATGKKVFTTRCPLRISGRKLLSERPAPQLGAHTAAIQETIKKVRK